MLGDDHDLQSAESDLFPNLDRLITPHPLNRMTPTALYINANDDDLNDTQTAMIVEPSAVVVVDDDSHLAVGSLTTARDGQYQSLLSSLKGEVERQMLDRIIDDGK